MMIPTWLGSEADVSSERSIPERLSGSATTALLVVDSFAVAIAAVIVGLPLNTVPAVCLVLDVALWGVGGARVSYALRSRDECYHVLAALALAAVPLVFLLVFVGDFDILRVLGILPIAALVLCPLHFFAHGLRVNDMEIADGGADIVSPRAQRRATLPFVRSYRRAINLTLASLALLCTSPLMLVVATALFLQSGSPVLFKQERTGRDGHRFMMLKFRTMRVDAGSAWAQPGDSRITPFGAFLRRMSLDELPQLFNVVRGQMSLVGPRPEMHEFTKEFRATIPHYDERVLVAPGITGWAQVNLKRNLEPAEIVTVVPYDLFYVEHASIGLDLFILAKTIAEVLFHRAV